MQSFLYHLQINIDFQNIEFYRKLMTFLGWSVIFEMDGLAGFKSGQNGDLWFAQSMKKDIADYDGRGVNHISLRVSQKEDVDSLTAFLKENSVEPLFDTPRHRPEFSSSENETYYQVMFKTVDNILFEVVYIGMK
jgi:hypothetical protein